MAESTGNGALTLWPELAEMVARRVVELLQERWAPGALMDAAEVGVRYGVERSWVYEHADELGAVRLGDGPRARLRFDPRRVEEAIAARTRHRGSQVDESPAKAQVSSRRRKARRGSSAQLLPIRGRS